MQLPGSLSLPKRATAFAFVLVLSGCSSGSAVTRVANGRDIDGRFITPDAYAEYLDGALLEERGDLRGAEAAYERALDEDGGAAEIWARLGRVRCTNNRRGADTAFTRARSKGPEVASVWLADAECALERGDASRARSSAERAASLEPRSVRASLVVIAALVQSGDRESAARWLRAVRLLYAEAATLPPSLEAALARAALRAREATPRKAETPAPSPRAAAETRAAEALDQALRAGDATAARRAAISAHVGNGWLALRAVELGQPSFAKEAAELTLSAEPGNIDARVAALAVADLERDDQGLRKWATKLPSDHEPPSALSARIMAELLSRRVGADAARTFSDAWAVTHASAGK